MARIFVTGSNRGIGAALIRLAKSEGHEPIGTTRDGRDQTIALTFMDFAGFAHSLTVNSIAPLAVAQAILPWLRESPAPKIITISSQMAWMGCRKADRIAYSASKAAVNKVMQGLAIRDTGKFFRFTGDERAF